MKRLDDPLVRVNMIETICHDATIYWSEPSCSKLTMSLVSIVKTLIIRYGIYANIFAEKCEYLKIFSLKSI